MDDDLRAAVEKLKDSGKLVIVEGSRDKKALEMLGIFNVVMLSRKPLFSIIEEIAATAKDVVILTDLDREGKQLYGRISTGLQREGVRIDNEFRDFLFRKTKIRQIEGLKNYAD